MIKPAPSEYLFTGPSLIPAISDDGHQSVIRASRQAYGGQPRLLVEVGSIEAGETPEQLLAGDLVSQVSQIELPPEDALELARFLVSSALPGDHAERVAGLVNFTSCIRL